MDPSSLLGPVRRAVPGATAVARLERLSGGANNETWSLDAVGPDGAVPLILRRKAGGGHGTRAPGDPDDASIGAEAEAAVLAAAVAAGVPAPAVRAVLEPADALGRGFLMDRLSGETRPKRLLHDAAFARARGRVLADCGRALARLHATPLAAMPPLRASSAQAELGLWERRWRRYGGARPVFELALRWLHANAPPPLARPAPVHGDFRTGNLLVDEDGLVAVLDWELAHAGDPFEDLGWLCVRSWRFGVDHLPMGGISRREELFDAYARASGRPVDPDVVRFWEVYGNLRWGVFTLVQVRSFLEGLSNSVELASIGRRTAETEWELLNLIEGKGF